MQTKNARCERAYTQEVVKASIHSRLEAKTRVTGGAAVGVAGEEGEDAPPQPGIPTARVMATARRARPSLHVGMAPTS